MTPLPPAWADALARRRPLADLADPETCLRLLHGEAGPLRCDRFGPVCWFYWYDEAAPDEAALDRVGAFTEAAGARHWHVHGMADRGRAPQGRRHWASREAPSSWAAAEDGLRYGLRDGRGQSPGLFLDQRPNRRWLRAGCRGARVLNLFAYTGAFGLAALAGGAQAVCQVDISGPYLDWARQNAARNGLDGVEYAAVDARRFLQGCRRRGRRFDLVVCDPPSFARGRKGDGVLRVERDLAGLVAGCVGVTEPGGRVLVSANYEGWSRTDFEREVAAGAGAGSTLTPAPGAGPDFAAGGAEAGLKSTVVRVA